jgi:unsaturated rhamnogalacturonyl hydrolase
MSFVRSIGIGIASAIFLTATTLAGDINKDHFTSWPDGASPAEVGKRVAENFLPRKLRCESDPTKTKEGVIYPEVIAWYGSLTVASLTQDQGLADRLVQKFEPLLSETGSKKINQSAHVDYRVFGALPLEIYMQNKDGRCRDLGLSLADAQWKNPTPDGITSEARYWIDDMYMIPLVQAQAYRATADTKYIDRAALTMVAYFEKMQQPNGLFFHGTDSHFYWGRGNGWMAAGSAELLRSLPTDHPQRMKILAGYQKMMSGLLGYQAEDGMWRQLIDKPESWPESSGTAMFAFAMVSGVKNGWLDEKVYGPAARKSWISLTKMLDENANLREVCVGTNKGFDEAFYLDRPRTAGDLHGQAPLLWTASALLRR